MLNHLKSSDPELFSAIEGEIKRQESGLELIASENFVSPAILEAVGTVLTNKYAEGMPGKRYYGGCEMVDRAENLASSRACQLFSADYANVQPHSGSQANMAVYMSALEPGDTILAMDLDAGGHLTHGSPVNFSGRLYNIVSYGVDKANEHIDYDEVASLARTHKPKMIVAGASAYPHTLNYERFSAIAKEVGALFMVDMAHIAGLIATGLHPSPVPYADYVTTTTHKTLRGPRGGMILAKAKYAKALNSSVCPRIQGGPLMHVIAGKAVAFKEAMTPEFITYQKQVLSNAKSLASAMEGLGYRLVGGGTDTHLLLIDLNTKNITGKLAEKALDQAGITVNKNKIPFDTTSPFVTSGIRLGTPAITTRGMKNKEMEQIARFINQVLSAPEDTTLLADIKTKVAALTAQFPLYRQLFPSIL